MYIIEVLKSYDRKSFDCGEDTLNRYFHERSRQDIKRKLNQVFVCIEAGKSRVIGYYTLAATTIEAAKLPQAHAKYLPKYPIPAVLLSKLAVDITEQGKGIGKLLLANAIRRVQEIQKDIGIDALVVDPMRDELIEFYASLGFFHFPPERRLFLFMSSLDG
jgi:GNAT superfamily N-acetyltransferase